MPLLCSADQASLDQAEKLFQAGDWEKARQAYKAELANVPKPSRLPPSFFFNYGTILAKAGAPGEAYVSLMHAAFAQPFDGDTKHNLKKVEQTLPASVRSVQPALWISWWPRFLRTIPWGGWLLTAMLISALAFSMAPSLERPAWISLLAVAGVFFLLAGLSYLQMRLPVSGVLVVAKVKSGPATTFTDITTLEPGSLVNEEGQRSGWHKVRFTKGGGEETIGWVEPATLLELN